MPTYEKNAGEKRAGHGADRESGINEGIINAVGEAARAGKLPCARAFQLANRFGVAPIVIGRAAEDLGIKISHCQLGCFGPLKRGGGE